MVGVGFTVTWHVLGLWMDDEGVGCPRRVGCDSPGGPRFHARLLSSSAVPNVAVRVVPGGSQRVGGWSNVPWLGSIEHSPGEGDGGHAPWFATGPRCSGGGGTDEATGGMMVVVGSNVRVATVPYLVGTREVI